MRLCRTLIFLSCYKSCGFLMHWITVGVVCLLLVSVDARCQGISNPYECTRGCIWSIKESRCFDVSPQPWACAEKTSAVVTALSSPSASLDQIYACDNTTGCEFHAQAYQCVEQRGLSCVQQSLEDACVSSPGCVWMHYQRACIPVARENTVACSLYSASVDFCLEGSREESCVWDTKTRSCLVRDVKSFVPWAHVEWCRRHDGPYCMSGVPVPWLMCPTYVSQHGCEGDPMCVYSRGACSSKVVSVVDDGVRSSMFPGETHWIVFVIFLMIVTTVSCITLTK